MMFFSLFFLNLTFAKTDSQLGFQGRSFPMIGGEFMGEIGKSRLLWGEENQKNKKPFFGFTRASLQATTSAVINAGKAEVEIYPLSFLGFAAGYQQVHSNFDFPFFDCDAIYCRGRLERRFIESRLGLGAKGYILLANYRQDHLQHNKNAKPFGDFRKVLIGNPGHDLFEEVRVVIGKTINQTMIGVVSEWSRMRISREQAQSTFLIYQWKKEQSTWMVGGGSFVSDEVGLGPIFYLRYIYQIKPSIKIL